MQAAEWREAFITSTSRLALPIRELRLVETGAQVPTTVTVCTDLDLHVLPTCMHNILLCTSQSGLHLLQTIQFPSAATTEALLEVVRREMLSCSVDIS